MNLLKKNRSVFKQLRKKKRNLKKSSAYISNIKEDLDQSKSRFEKKLKSYHKKILADCNEYKNKYSQYKTSINESLDMKISVLSQSYSKEKLEIEQEIDNLRKQFLAKIIDFDPEQGLTVEKLDDKKEYLIPKDKIHRVQLHIDDI